MTWYARLLGAEVGRDVDLHSIPPVTGLLRLGTGCSIEPEVDLSGYWVDGDVVHLGPVRVGARARVGARSMLLPGRGRRRGRRGRAGLGGLRQRAGRRVLVRLAGRADPERARGPVGGPAGDHPRLGRGLRRGGGAALAACRPRRAGGRGAAGAAGRGPDVVRATCSPLLAWLPVSALVGLVVLALLVVARGARGRARRAARRAPGAQRRGPGGLGHDAGPRRGPHLALPALLLEPHADLAAAARRPDREGRGGVDGADGARRSPRSTTRRSWPTTP